MKIKLLPIAAAIASVLAPMSVFADSNNGLKEEGLVFSGYARYGMHYSDDENKYIKAGGEMGQAAGRLGNESNGGEFQLTQTMHADGGSVWDLALMIDHWGDQVGLKKSYARGTNVLAAQPNASVWAGRDFHQRGQEDLTDYFWMEHDGQGGGIYDLELGGVKLDFSVVTQIEGTGTGDSGNYAATSKLHGINLGAAGDLSFIANYGFESYQYDDNGDRTNADKTSAYQVAAILDSRWAMGPTKIVARYSDNAENNVFNKTEGQTSLYTSFAGTLEFEGAWDVQYQLSYNNEKFDDTPSDDRSGYSAVVRPMYTWNESHSTWVEAGYSLVDYDNDEENQAWKVTLSQNVSFGKGAGARPMVRFYASVGETDNQVVEGYEEKQDTLAVGAMFEAWW